MPALTTVLASVLASGGRAARYGEYTVVIMHGGSFVTTPMEFTQAQNWARARTSTGNAVRDRASFVDHIETVLAGSGSGYATKGHRGVLSRMVKSMIANAMVMDQWNVPHNLEESVEIKKKPPASSGPGPGTNAS